MCETAKAVIQHWCGLGVESRALVLEPQALLVLPSLQPRLYSRRREFQEGITGPLRRPGDAGGSWTHLQKLSDPDSQCLVSIPTVWCPPIVRSPIFTVGPPSPLCTLHPHSGASVPIVGSPSLLWGLYPPLCALHPHSGASPHCGGIHPHCGVSIFHCGVFIPFLGSPPPLCSLHSLYDVPTPDSRDPIPVPRVPHARGFLVTHVDSWARCRAAQEGFLFTFLPQRLPSAFRTLIGDWSLPLWSLPPVQLCPARPGWVAL